MVKLIQLIISRLCLMFIEWGCQSNCSIHLKITCYPFISNNVLGHSDKKNIKPFQPLNFVKKNFFFAITQLL